MVSDTQSGVLRDSKGESPGRYGYIFTPMFGFPAPGSQKTDISRYRQGRAILVTWTYRGQNP